MADIVTNEEAQCAGVIIVVSLLYENFRCRIVPFCPTLQGPIEMQSEPSDVLTPTEGGRKGERSIVGLSVR